MVRKISLFVICILAIVITIFGVIAYIYNYKKTQALNTSYIWCYNDWKCKAPNDPDKLHIFNILNPGICNGSSCSAGEIYNAYDKGPYSEKVKSKCKVTDKEFTDTNFAVINRTTGCRCMVNSNTPCTLMDLENDITNCKQDSCGVIPKTCTEFKLATPEIPEIAIDLARWRWDTTTTPSIGEVLSYYSDVCPVPDNNSNIFFNKFILGLRKHDS